MPLVKGKSPEAFKHNLKAELAAGKPMKQSLAIAYSQKKKKKMAFGGAADQDSDSTDVPMKSGKGGGPLGLAGGGNVTQETGQYIDNPEGKVTDYSDVPTKLPPPEHEVSSDRAKGAYSSGFDSMMAKGGMIDKVMQKRGGGSIKNGHPYQFSEGGKIANGGDDDLDMMADGKPNNFDDLALRDDLESSSDGENNGDMLGNAHEDARRMDMIDMIMKSRVKKDKMPRPA